MQIKDAKKSQVTQFGSYLVVLIGRDRDEGGLGENVRAEGRVLGAEAVILVGFHNVDPRLILVHGIQDDLEGKGGWEGLSQV